MVSPRDGNSLSTRDEMSKSDRERSTRMEEKVPDDSSTSSRSRYREESSVSSKEEERYADRRARRREESVNTNINTEEDLEKVSERRMRRREERMNTEESISAPISNQTALNEVVRSETVDMSTMTIEERIEYRRQQRKARLN
jgi:hypothetical protein